MAKNITGLFGHTLKHSFSPAMHNAAFKALGLTDWEYQLFEFSPEELDKKVICLEPVKICVGLMLPFPIRLP